MAQTVFTAEPQGLGLVTQIKQKLDRHTSGSLTNTLCRRSLHDQFLGFRQRLTADIRNVIRTALSRNSTTAQATDADVPLTASTMASNRSGSGSRSAQMSFRSREGRHCGRCHAGLSLQKTRTLVQSMVSQSESTMPPVPPPFAG